MADKTFADGLMFKLPRDGAPDFVKGSLSIKAADFVAFLNEPEAPAVAKENAPIEYPLEDLNPDDIPF